MKYIVASNEGHGSWLLSDELDESELLDAICGGYSTEYKVLAVVDIKLEIKVAE